MKNMGKVFEEDFQRSIPTDIYYKRFKDDQGGFKNVFNTCDFLIFNRGIVFLFELKSVQGDMIPFVKFGEQRQSGVTYKRLQKFFHEGECKDVRAGFLVEYRKSGVVAYFTADQILDIVLGGWFPCKSIPLTYAKEHALLIPRHLKRTRYGYDIEALTEGVLEHHAKLRDWGTEQSFG